MSEYDTDFALWSERQAKALRRRANNEIDWENVAEEIESLGKSDKREIRNRLAVICAHLLKWRYQPDTRSNSWRASVAQARDEIAALIEDSPSLKDYPAGRLSDPRGGAYAQGRKRAVLDTGIADLPDICPWTIEQVLDPDFWPGD
jgi:hypothetical protein